MERDTLIGKESTNGAGKALELSVIIWSLAVGEGTVPVETMVFQ